MKSAVVAVILLAVALAAASASAGTVFTREKAGAIWQKVVGTAPEKYAENASSF